MAVTAEAVAEMGLERRAYARVGLLGNPSDVYGGRRQGAILHHRRLLGLRPSPELLIQPHPHHDLVAFPSLPQLVSTLSLLSLISLCRSIYQPSYLISNPFNQSTSFVLFK